MADGIITNDAVCSLHMDHADIRREAASYSADIRRENAEVGAEVRRDVVKEGSDTNANVKSSGWQVSDRVGTEADRIVQQDTAYFIAGQSQQFSNATALAALRASTDANFNQTLAAITLAAEKNAAATAMASANNAALTAREASDTRAYISSLKMTDLNRELQERNQEIVECRSDARVWERNFGQSQFAALTSQVQNLMSQVQETKQGIVNFGSMAGQSGQQTSTSNNVK